MDCARITYTLDGMAWHGTHDMVAWKTANDSLAVAPGARAFLAPKWSARVPYLPATAG